jgi:hypothetical protein
MFIFNQRVESMFVYKLKTSKFTFNQGEGNMLSTQRSKLNKGKKEHRYWWTKYTLAIKVRFFGCVLSTMQWEKTM